MPACGVATFDHAVPSQWRMSGGRTPVRWLRTYPTAQASVEETALTPAREAPCWILGAVPLSRRRSGLRDRCLG